jgi:hypothetical protein
VSHTLDYLHDGGYTTVRSPPILSLLLRACYAHTTCSALLPCTDCTPEQLLYPSQHHYDSHSILFPQHPPPRLPMLLMMMEQF